LQAAPQEWHQSLMAKSSLRALLLILVMALPLAACRFGGVTPQQDADLRAVYQKMRANDLAGIEAQFDPQFRTPALHQSLGFMQGMIPPQTPRARLLKGVTETDPQGRLNYGAQYEFDYPSTAVLAQIEMRQDKAGHRSVVAVQLRQAPVGIADSYAFSLKGKKYYQYLFLVLVALAPGMGVWGLAALWRAPDIKWKVLWAAAMCLGFMDLTMDWTTGDVVLNIVDIHILWLKASRFGPLSPWMISTSLPLASIAFLLGYRRLERPWDGPRASS
jgi:hypothetical protein